MYGTEAEAAAGQVQITAIKALQQHRGATLVKVETDAGIYRIGPCHGSGPFVRAVIAGSRSRVCRIWA